ncbi:MAG TPA: DUF983 domain-containing protein [Methylomirabilota bacterium]|nr:DUF983 domain-containing protein [Methylomirabilota bacterium]
MRAVRYLARALRLRCPHCGRGRATSRWLVVRRRCPACGFRLDRGESDYFLGAIMFNMIAAETIFAVGLLGVVWLTWPQPPWNAMLWGGAAVMIAAPIVCYPFSKTVWLAFDLIFRPPTASDFAPDAERADA